MKKKLSSSAFPVVLLPSAKLHHCRSETTNQRHRIAVVLRIQIQNCQFEAAVLMLEKQPEVKAKPLISRRLQNRNA